jgi:putative flippase GtrA
MNQSTFWQLARYGVVGLGNLALYFGVYAGSILVGAPYVLAALAGYLIASSVGYLSHEHWTFGGRSPSIRGWVMWLAAQGVGAAANVAMLSVVIHGFGLPPILAQLVVLPIVPVTMFLVGRRWVFTRTAAIETPWS